MEKKAQHPTLSARTRWRMRAVEILYEAESRSAEVAKVLTERADRMAADPDGVQQLPPYAVTLARGVDEHRLELDQILNSASQGWSVARMAPVDRNVLRVGLFEIRHVDEVDTPVAIKEAMKVASTIGSTDDPSFVNGVLHRAQFIDYVEDPEPAGDVPKVEPVLDEETPGADEPTVSAILDEEVSPELKAEGDHVSAAGSSSADGFEDDFEFDTDIDLGDFHGESRDSDRDDR
ncbi:transcription antitermination factor NusB [Natronoglycomyces albus]|uniref:Transcription antitermination protein NusB n=1 Tax=Natronoglycomyces albus TaxID=2811108 RepID=A0A895XWK7_9ACTN|nr:transcription antitermination factor NusB [Natronoglycomyces albus]QSB06610.1 transcription antitermination factor NusB [Natronoglycomyces albus]